MSLVPTMASQGLVVPPGTMVQSCPPTLSSLRFCVAHQPDVSSKPPFETSSAAPANEVRAGTMASAASTRFIFPSRTDVAGDWDDTPCPSIEQAHELEFR